MKYYTLFFRKLGKMLENLSSAAVVIGGLKVNQPAPFSSTLMTMVFWEVRLFSERGLSYSFQLFIFLFFLFLTDFIQMLASKPFYTDEKFWAHGDRFLV